jgi:hypothetical protein
VKGRAPAAIFVVILCALQCGAAAWWAHQNGSFCRPPATEDAYRRLQTAELKRILVDQGVGAWLLAGWRLPGTHTPLLFMVTSVVALRNPGIDVNPADIWIAMAVFCVLFTVGTYRLAHCFFGTAAAFLAAALSACMPTVLTSWRSYSPQWPMAAISVWALEPLLRSDGLQRIRPALRFGFFAGLATMAKVIAPVYLAGATLAALALGSTAPGRWRRVLRGVGSALVAFVVVVGPWLARNLTRVEGYAEGVLSESPVDSNSLIPIWSWKRWSYYPLSFLNGGTGFPLAAVGLAAFVVLWLARRNEAPQDAQGAEELDRRRSFLILAAGVLVSWFLLTVNKTSDHSYYLVGWAPAAGIAVAGAVTLLPRPRLRITFVCLAAGAALLSLWLALRPLGTDRPLLVWKDVEILGRADTYYSSVALSLQAVPRPEAEPWPMSQFARRILEDAPDRKASVATTHPYLCAPNLRYEARRLGRDFLEVPIPWIELLTGRGDSSVFSRIDYVVLDSLIFDVAAVSALLEPLGIRCEAIARKEILPGRALSLVALRRSG